MQHGVEHTAYQLSKTNHQHTFLVTVNPNNGHEGLVGVRMTPQQMHAAGYYKDRPPLLAYHGGNEVPFENWANYGV